MSKKEVSEWLDSGGKAAAANSTAEMILRSEAWKGGNRPGMDIFEGQGQQSRTK